MVFRPPTVASYLLKTSLEACFPDGFGLLLFKPFITVYMESQLYSQQIIMAAKDRLPYLRAHSHILWEPYRNAWVGVLLNYFIGELEKCGTDLIPNTPECIQATELLAEYHQCLHKYTTGIQPIP